MDGLEVVDDVPAHPLARPTRVLTVRTVLQLCDESISHSDAWWIVDKLRTIGRADDTISASAIERALLDDEFALDLRPDGRQAVLMVLADCPPSLRRLRTTLARDLRDRFP